MVMVLERTDIGGRLVVMVLERTDIGSLLLE